jgi:hypothetical protein
MSKYIIEVDDNAVDGLFKAKGFNTLVFDQNGLDKLQKYEEPVKEQFFPQLGNMYYTIAIDNNEVIRCFQWDDDAVDFGRMSIGNCFRTKEEAEFAVERLKVLAEMRKFAEPFNTKWDCKTCHYFIYIDINTNELIVNHNIFTRNNKFYFSSRERAKECIKAVGEDRIKKYYLGVE